MKRKNIIQKGMSLLEVLIVVTIFAVLGVLVTQSIILTLIGSQKSEAIIRARENLDYSLSIIERQIRNANSITECPNSDTKIINYTDHNGTSSSFSCVNTGGTNSYIASGSARLTSNTVKVEDCTFSCTQSSFGPPLISINLTVKDASASGIRSASVTAETEIYLRNY